MEKKNLRGSIEHYRAVFFKSPVGMTIYDSTGQCIEANEAIGPIIGATKDQVLSQNYNNVESWKKSGLLDAANEAKQTKKTVNVEVTVTSTYERDVTGNASLSPFSIGEEDFLLFTFNDLSKQKELETVLSQKEGELHQSETLFKSIVDNSSALTILTNAEGVTTFISPQCQEVIGYPSSKFLGETFPDILHPEDVERCKKSWEEVALEGKELKRFEYRIIDSEGSTRWVSHSAKLVMIDEKPFGMQNQIVNITERKTAELALEKSQTFNETILNTSPDVIYVYDIVEKQNIYSNEKTGDVLGYSKKEIRVLGQKLIETLMDPDDYQVYLNETIPKYLAAKDGELIESLYKMQHKNGHWRWLLSRELVFLRTDDGLPKQIFGMISDVTDKKLAEEKIKKGAEKFKLLFENMTSGFALHDMIYDESGNPTDYRFIEANPAFEHLTGARVKDLIGKTVKEVMPGTEQHWIETFAKVADTGEPISYENYAKELGKYYDTYSFSPQKGQFAVVFNDITDRKEAENLLDVQKQLAIKLSAAGGLKETFKLCLETAMEISSNDAGGIYMVDDETGDIHLQNTTGLSDVFIERVKHYAADSVQAEIIMSGNPIYMKPKELKTLLKGAQKQEGLLSLAVIPITHKNKVIACLNIASHEKEEIDPKSMNPLESLVAQMGSVIARAKSEEALRESEERYKSFVHHSSEGIYRVDIDPPVQISKPTSEIIEHVNAHAVIAEVNDALAHMYGLLVKDMIGKPAVNYARNYGVRAEMILHNEGYFVSNIETEDVDKDGKRLFLEESYHGEVVDGHLVRIWGVQRNVTERKLIEEQLRQSEKMQAIGQLAGGVAHDYNNQLAGIVGYADLLRDELSGNLKLAHFADNILLASKRSADLTSQLLAFARKGKYLSVEIDLHKIIGEVAAILAHTIDKRVVIKQHLDAQSPTIKGDPSQIQNAFMNLALNARDAMPDGGELVFATEHVLLDEEFCRTNPYKIEPGNFVQLSVRDTGSGMDKETQNKMFEPFFTTKDPGKGTGMGLAAVFGTVKNHFGSISVYSEIDNGTMIKIFLPRLVAEKGLKESASTSREHVKGSGTILLVDDEGMIVDTCTMMLNKFGYKVHACRNGAEAVEYYKDNWKEVDLIILDMIMPEMNGATAYGKMKEINPELRVLISSGFSLTSKAKELMDEGAIDFIQKPFRSSDLSQRISEALYRK